MNIQSSLCKSDCLGDRQKARITKSSNYKSFYNIGFCLGFFKRPEHSVRIRKSSSYPSSKSTELFDY